MIFKPLRVFKKWIGFYIGEQENNDIVLFRTNFDSLTKKISYCFFQKIRLAVNFVITFGFFGFWHCALYLVGLSERPFNPTRHYRFSKVLHNMWYCFLGVVQMTIWEAIFMHCYATKRLPFMNDKEAFSNSWNITMFVLAAFWVPLYRELHFYFAHR